jgi:hypothetical protein
MKLFKTILAALAMPLTMHCCFQPVFADVPRTEPAINAHALADGNEMVMFNENSHKYHSLTCAHVEKCTHCIKIKRSEAKAKGGVACKTCNGGE